MDRFNFFTSEAEKFLAIIQIINLYKNNKINFQKACTYRVYELEKERYKQLLHSFNSSWGELNFKESRRRLIVEFPDFYSISNGERDVLSFVALLATAKRNLNKNSNLLVIDEVFDYLDDANLIAVQYFISQLIEEYKALGKRIYTLILTHLDPNYFRNFVFSKQKVYYLNAQNLQVNQNLINLLCKRNEPSIQDDVSKYLLHFHPSCINKRHEFKGLGLKETWGEGYNFDDFINKEISKYLGSQADYDPFAVCCSLRKKIEKIIYAQLKDIHSKTKFIETHKTQAKLSFAEECGINVPEVYYLLGIIYNDGMHWKYGRDNVSPLASKLENRNLNFLIHVVFKGET